MANMSLTELQEYLVGGYQRAEAAKKRRYEEGLASLKGVAELYGPGYGEGLKKEAQAAAEAKLYSTGLSRSTRPAAVSAGLTAKFEDLRRGKLAQALANIAQFQAGWQDIYATPPTLTGLALGRSQIGLEQLGQFNAARRNIPTTTVSSPTVGGGGYTVPAPSYLAEAQGMGVPGVFDTTVGYTPFSADIQRQIFADLAAGEAAGQRLAAEQELPEWKKRQLLSQLGTGLS